MKQKCEEDVLLIENVIKTGHNNALTRAYLTKLTGLSDRMLRRAIALSTKPIVNNGYGYFVADINDPIDRSEAHAYRAQERARIQSTIDKMDAKFSDFDNEPSQEFELDNDI